MKRSHWHGSREWLGSIIGFVYICESISQVSASIHEYKTNPSLFGRMLSSSMAAVKVSTLPTKMRRSMAKLELYRKFTNSLAIFVLLSIAWIGYELYFNASDPLSELWRIAWIIPAFWTLLAFSLLVVICVLWAPSSNPTRYAYSAGDDFDEELKRKLQISLFGSCYIAGHSIM